MVEKTARRRCMMVVPILNEAKHIERVIEQLQPSAERLDMKIVIADGGSTDGTREILHRITAQNRRVLVIDNTKRLQSAGVNKAIEQLGDANEYFIRIDAHADYPDDYCDQLIEEALARDADSVVVSIRTEGLGLFQKATAWAQNSRLGNGGSKHRIGAKGHWTDHGHHALMRVAAFRTVGGYDESFAHNEDAELDHRLRAAGYRIWMTGETAMTYYPRSTALGLYRQYFGYGRGRAKNLLKHRTWPKIRQALPLAVMPVVGGMSLALIHWSALLPVAVWAGLCVGYGVVMGIGLRNPYAPLSGIPAMIMHFAWSAGFWTQLLEVFKRRKSTP